MKSLKLNKLAKNSIDLKNVQGGTLGCVVCTPNGNYTCGCKYADCGGSSDVNNGSANAREGKNS